MPDVTVSRPARQCIRVDLPEPDGPMMAVNSPAPQVDVDVIERDDGGRPGAETLDHVGRAGGDDPPTAG